MTKTFKESIIDIPRRTYAPAVFDDANTDNPVIKPSVKRQIDIQLKEFETDYPIIKTAFNWFYSYTQVQSRRRFRY